MPGLQTQPMDGSSCQIPPHRNGTEPAAAQQSQQRPLLVINLSSKSGIADDFLRRTLETNPQAGSDSEYSRPVAAVDCTRSGWSPPECSQPLQQLTLAGLHDENVLKNLSPQDIVVFLDHRLTSKSRKVIERLGQATCSQPGKFLIVMPSMAIHFGDPVAERNEQWLQSTLTTGRRHLIILRTGFIRGCSSGRSVCCIGGGFRRMVPAFLTSTFVDAEDLHTVIEAELTAATRRLQRPWNGDKPLRKITLLGKRCSWRSVLQADHRTGLMRRLTEAVAAVFAWTGIQWLAVGLLLLLARFRPVFRRWHFSTLRPKSVSEILSLYNRHNHQHLRTAGYNNGVNHFGWRFPEQTVVMTTELPGRVRLSDDRVTTDAGVTLKRCIRELRAGGREFAVVPNYSWISMGTLFFVPVHGSGRAVSTLGDTIEQVLLFDARREQFVRANRNDDLFRDLMYDRSRPLLLLRLKLRVQARSRYMVLRTSLQDPSTAEVLKQLRDPEASHVEIRKSRAADETIDVRRFYADSITSMNSGTELPRDEIGKVWDRLEETPVVSFLFHWFVRTFAFHVELFLRPDEFDIFWKHHQSLPLSKIQLRLVLKDGITHSACRDHDCISADLFMTRKHRDVFCRFIDEHLPHVRTNPGKQSL